MGPRQEDSEFKSLEFDSTLGYTGEGPPRVPDFGSMERCTDCDLTPWRVSRGGNAGKCESAGNVRGGCVRRATTLRREESPPYDNEMPDQNDTAADDEMLHDDATLHILESMRELAKKNMSNTITFIPHRLKERFARVYSSKLNELSSHMQRGEDTLKREMLNLLVWAMPALILSEDEPSTELHKEHHSRSAGLNQRLAEAEQEEMGSLIQRAHKKQQEEEERKTRTPTNWRTKSKPTSAE